MDNKKLLLSVKDLEVKFRVRGRILTAIRNISLDIYEGESIAIVGESGSGKSVFTKTFAGMLDSNGFISSGELIFDDDVLADTVVKLNDSVKGKLINMEKKLNEYARLANGAATYNEIQKLEKEKEGKSHISDEEREKYQAEIKELIAKKTDIFNLKQTYDPSKEKDKIKKAAKEIAEFDEKIKAKEAEVKRLEAEKKHAAAADAEFLNKYHEKTAKLNAKYHEEISHEASEKDKARNKILAKEIYLSVGRYNAVKRNKMIKGLEDALKKAYQVGVDLDDESQRNGVFNNVTFRVKYLDETADQLHGTCVIDLASIKDPKDWTQIRGKAPDLMRKVGIPNAEHRFDDYPFQYSGGMRQRIVIAIALSCQPKILICDEPTTALDVTIQAQILQLIKDLQKFGYTIVFITHDLGVVANIADRVAVLYAGQVIELGTVEDVFYDPRHPYTWALLSSLPQLAQRNTQLYSITGTPPSLYNKIVGDSFAPRNPYCLRVDTLYEPPMFKVTDTHYAKTWLLDPRSPKISKPEAIENIHEKLIKAFNI